MAKGIFKKASAQMKPLITAVVLLIILGAVQPFLWKRVATSATKLQDTQTIEQQYADLQKRLEETTKSRNEQQELFDQLSVVYPNVNNTSQVIERLEQLATQWFVIMQIRTIQEDQPIKTKSDTLKIIPLKITVEVTAPPERILSYVDAVEHMQELARITSFLLQEVDPTAPGTTPVSPDQEVSLIMNIEFYLRGN